MINKNISNNVSPDAYDSPPWWYDIRGFFILTFSYRDTLWSQTAFFSKNIKRVHLEGAIGTGTLSYFILIYKKHILKQEDFYFLGLDYAPEMLKGATKKLRGKNVEIILGDLTKLKYKDDYFDSINLANSFHTIKDIDLAIHELTRVLKPHGQLATNILLEPKTFGFLDKISRLINKWGRKKGILYKAYLESEIYEIINKESQLAIESIQTKGNALYLTLIKKG